jgi:MFS family permease
LRGEPTSDGKQERQTILALATCQALFQTGSILIFTIAGIAGLALAPSKMWATLPIAMTALGAGIATIPAAMLMARFGRKAGFLVGTCFGALGGALGTAALVTGNFVLLCTATLLVGTYQGFAQFYRFAAAEASSPAFRSKAVSYVIAGGVAAAVAGPQLAIVTKEVGTWPTFTGSFATIVLLSVGAALVLRSTDLRRVPATQAQSGQPRSFGQLAKQPAFVAAVGGATIGFTVMAIPMTATPLSMVTHDHSVSAAAMVIQWHVLGMTAPSFFTGSLIKRFRAEAVMLVGALALAVHVAISLIGTAFIHYALALTFLGIGWNFLYIGGTTLLTETYVESEKAKVQGFNDLLVVVVLVIGSFAAGPLNEILGWRGLNLAMLPLIALAVGMIVRSMFKGTGERAAPSLAG